MKLFPCLTIASLCAAFVGCSTTQTVSFEPENTAQDGVTVSIDGKTLGVVPVEFETMRTETAKAHQVVFSKPGYRSEVAVIESYEDTDGLQSFMDSYPIPELVPVPAAPAAEPTPAPEPVAEPTPAPEPAEEPAPAPAPEEEPEVEDVEEVDDEESVFEEEVDEAEDVEDVEEPAVDEVEDVEDVEEPAPEPAADEPAPEPAPEPAVDEVDEVEDVEEVDEPAVDEVDEVEDTKEPADAEGAPAASDLDPTRTLKDIEADLKSLVAQRQNGQLSEAEFQKACAELEKEVRTRYGK